MIVSALSLAKKTGDSLTAGTSRAYFNGRSNSGDVVR